jgi:hypothetical protein
VSGEFISENPALAHILSQCDVTLAA